jgi:hypothetical protein
VSLPLHGRHNSRRLAKLRRIGKENLDLSQSDSTRRRRDGRDGDVDRGGDDDAGEVERETGVAEVGEFAADDGGAVREGDQGREDLIVRVDAVL